MHTARQALRLLNAQGGELCKALFFDARKEDFLLASSAR